MIADALDGDVVVIDEFAEVHHGLFAGLTNAEIEERFPGEMDLRSQDKYRWCFPGGESYQQAAERAAAGLRRVAASGSRAPLLVTHEMTGRMLVKVLRDLDPDVALTRSLQFGRVLVIRPT